MRPRRQTASLGSSSPHDTSHSPAERPGLNLSYAAARHFFPDDRDRLAWRGPLGVPYPLLPPIMAYFRQCSMFEIVFLGTAAAVPSAERGSPALLVSHGPARFLVDCGEGTPRPLLPPRLPVRGL